MEDNNEISGKQYRKYVAPIKHAHFLALSAAQALLLSRRDYRLNINLEEIESMIKRSNKIVNGEE